MAGISRLCWNLHSFAVSCGCALITKLCCSVATSNSSSFGTRPAKTRTHKPLPSIRQNSWAYLGCHGSQILVGLIIVHRHDRWVALTALEKIRLGISILRNVDVAERRTRLLEFKGQVTGGRFIDGRMI